MAARHDDSGDAPIPSLFPSSKRAARRLIQRALVLVARDRHVRQHLREARVVTRWILEDWNFEWTVILDRGRIDFDRRPAKKPALVLAWERAEEFFRQAEMGRVEEEGFRREGEIGAWRAASPLVRAFFPKLGTVLRYPVDDKGVSLV